VCDRVELGLIQRAEARFAEIVPEKTQARCVAILAVAVLIEELFDSFRNHIDLVGFDELV
jgi:hypothetical protein